jgi:hypothetical protein
LNDDLVFAGLFETYPNAEAYLKALTGLLSITMRLEVKKIIAEGNDVAVFFALKTKASAKATTLVAEWHQIKMERSPTSSRPLMASPSRPCSQARNGVSPCWRLSLRLYGKQMMSLSPFSAVFRYHVESTSTSILWVSRRTTSASHGPRYTSPRIVDGKIVEHWTNFDQFGILMQLGAIPS